MSKDNDDLFNELIETGRELKECLKLTDEEVYELLKRDNKSDMNKLIQYNSNEWQEHFEYTKGHYYAYIKTKDSKKYLFDSAFDKKESIKGVYKYLGVKNKKEYSETDKDNCTVPLFYKYIGDMGLIGINSFVKEAMEDNAEYVVIPFDYEDRTYIHKN